MIIIVFFIIILIYYFIGRGSQPRKTTTINTSSIDIVGKNTINENTKSKNTEKDTNTQIPDSFADLKKIDTFVQSQPEEEAPAEPIAKKVKFSDKKLVRTFDVYNNPIDKWQKI